MRGAVFFLQGRAGQEQISVGKGKDLQNGAEQNSTEIENSSAG